MIYNYINFVQKLLSEPSHPTTPSLNESNCHDTTEEECEKIDTKEPPVIDWWDLPSISTAWWFLVLRIFSSINVESKQSLPPVKDWMENSDILTVTNKQVEGIPDGVPDCKWNSGEIGSPRCTNKLELS